MSASSGSPAAPRRSDSCSQVLAMVAETQRHLRRRSRHLALREVSGLDDAQRAARSEQALAQRPELVEALGDSRPRLAATR